MIAIFHYSEPIQRIKNINFLSFSWKINRKWFYYFLIWKGVSIKRSFKLRDSTSSNFLPNYSLSSGRKLYRRSSTSHSLFLMRWCAKNLAEIIDFWWNSIDFDGFSNFHQFFNFCPNLPLFLSKETNMIVIFRIPHTIRN